MILPVVIYNANVDPMITYPRGERSGKRTKTQWRTYGGGIVISECGDHKADRIY